MTAMPDIALITMDEMARQAAYVTAAVQIPVIADADTGYGEAWNVIRCVREFERAGLAGIHLEDQVSPKRCGHLDGKTLISPQDMAAKIRAAVDARVDPKFFLIARTDARGVESLDAAIDRANLCIEAGADCVFPEGLQSAEEFAVFRERVPGPLLANMTEFGQSPLLPLAELRSLGYAGALLPVTLLRVAMKAAEDALAAIAANGTQRPLLDRMQSRQELYDLLGYTGYEARDRSYFQIEGDEAP